MEASGAQAEVLSNDEQATGSHSTSPVAEHGGGHGPNHQDEDEEWVTIPATVPAESFKHSAPSNYLHFKLQSRLGQFTIDVQPSTADSIGDIDTGVLPQSQSPLFKLPPELRVHVYAYVLRIPTDSSAVLLVRRPSTLRPLSVLTVLESCRRVYSEAATLFYSMNRITAEDHALWSSLGPLRQSAITMVALRTSSAGAVLGALQHLHDLPNLKSIHIARHLSAKYIDTSSWAIMVPQLVAEIRKLKALKELVIVTPLSTPVTAFEKEKELKLEEIDRKLYEAANT